MKLLCNQENLYQGLSLVSRIVSTRTTLPVLSNILLAAEPGQLKLSATDLEIGITTWIGAKVEKEGAITVPARLLSEFVFNNSDKKINMDLANSTVSLVSEKHQAHIKGIEASEFPLIPKVKKVNAITVKSSLLKKSLQQVVFACSTSETRPVLGGALLAGQDNGLILAATDSYRLAEKKISLIEKIPAAFKTTIPQKTILELTRILPDNEEKVEITIGENQIQFNFGSTELTSRLIEGEFPAYQAIIPQKSPTTVRAKTLELANAIKMASLFAREAANNIKIKMQGKDGLQITAISPQLGDNVSRLSSSIEGPDLEIVFNAKLVLDFLAVLEAEEVTIGLQDPFSPALFRSPSVKDYLYVLMPLRIEE